MRGVCGNISALMISVDGELQLHELMEALVIGADPVAVVVGETNIGVNLEFFSALILMGIVD